MVSERIRLGLASLLLLAAGAVAALANSSARTWVGAAVLLLAGLAVAWPLTRTRALPARIPDPPRANDAQRLALLQAQLEHLPVAAWVLSNDALHPLSSRARRLTAPG